MSIEKGIFSLYSNRKYFSFIFEIFEFCTLFIFSVYLIFVGLLEGWMDEEEN